MTSPFAVGDAQRMPWLPGERFQLALDSHKGVFTSPTPGADLLTVTTRRAVQLRRQPGKNSTTLIPLDKIVAIDIIDAARPTERLMQGLLLLVIGLMLAWIAWSVTGVALIALLMGGIPSLLGIYVLTGYLFPDTTGELILRAEGHALHHPLLSQEARSGAYLFAHRVYELMVSPGDASPMTANADQPEVPPEPAHVHEPPGVGGESAPTPPASWNSPSTNPAFSPGLRGENGAASESTGSASEPAPQERPSAPNP